MMRKILWTSLGVALIVAGIGVAWTETQPWRGVHGPFWFHHGPMGFVAHELDLKDAQKAKIRSMWEGERPKVADLVHELAGEQKEMDALKSQSGTPDEGRIEEIAAREGATLAKLIVEKENFTGKIYSQVLNPAQRAKADEIQEHWGSRLDRIADRIGNTSGER